jgi:hypothetical protein
MTIGAIRIHGAYVFVGIILQADVMDLCGRVTFHTGHALGTMDIGCASGIVFSLHDPFPCMAPDTGRFNLIGV